jgi:ABC-type bacteriocin/lantibiotic exporter with double-glycine peptidase domain
MVPQLVHSTASIDRLDELEKSACEQDSLTHSSRLMSGCLGLRLEKVNFGYVGGDHEVVRNFTHDFIPGSKSAIMGETGKGKTTLFRLLLGFVKPDDGRMLIYSETEVSSVTDATRSNFVYVPQGNTLMNGSVRYNLQLANPEASEKEMIDALHVACADFVDALPDGIDTEIGERGHGLSEGQAQRIAIARGLLRPGNILLFDEISSSLDEVTEAELYRRLFEAFPQKTMIFVTHRTAVCELCDSVIRM